MPRFFFHTQTDTRSTDNEGTELDTALKARRQAIQTCGELVKEDPEPFWNSRPWTVTVTDEFGLVLWELSMDGQSSAATMHLK